MTKKERLEAYESFFHRFQLAQVCCNTEKLREGVSLIFNWSYCHRCGNGMLSDKEQTEMVENVIRQMKDF